jgi:type VI secretion system protein ImpE
MTDPFMANVTEGGASPADALDLFRAGRLRDAITAASSAVRDAPDAIGKRLFLAELLLFAEEFARADTALAVMEAFDASLARISPFRQLLRAETIRRQTWREARLPEFLGEPTPALTLSLKALVMILAGDTAAAAEAARDAEAARPAAPGCHKDAVFDDIRDTDDISAGFLEVLTVSGRYFWVPFERIEEAVFHPVERLRDLFWRRCRLSVRGGPAGDIYIPATYVAPSAWESVECDALVAVGRKTDWYGDSLMRGLGQRVLLVGDDGIAFHDLGTLMFG